MGPLQFVVKADIKLERLFLYTKSSKNCWVQTTSS